MKPPKTSCAQICRVLIYHPFFLFNRNKQCKEYSSKLIQIKEICKADPSQLDSHSLRRRELNQRTTQPWSFAPFQIVAAHGKI